MFGKDIRRKGDEIPLYSMKVKLIFLAFKIHSLERSIQIFDYLLTFGTFLVTCQIKKYAPQAYRGILVGKERRLYTKS